MVNERVAVVLPVLVDVIVASHFSFVNRISSVPSSHVVLHPEIHVIFVVARAFTTCPVLPEGRREVEVSTSEISFKVVCDLETLSCGFVTLASTDFASVCACVGHRAIFNVAEWKVSSEAINISIRRPEFKQVSLSGITLTESSKP